MFGHLLNLFAMIFIDGHEVIDGNEALEGTFNKEKAPSPNVDVHLNIVEHHLVLTEAGLGSNDPICTRPQ